jgi:hypothetical protein
VRGRGDGEEPGTGPAPPARTLASRLRARNRAERPADAPEPVEPPAPPEADRTDQELSSPSRLRPQPEDDASVYPLF